MEQVYLDYAATTPTDREVLERMLPLFCAEFANPDSLHAFGRRADFLVSEARDRVANALGVRASEVYFTSGGTEADNWAVQKLGEGGICVSAIEHSAVLSAAEIRGGVAVARADGRGIVTAEAVERALTPRTGLVCVMAVNNETGCLQPLEEISALCRRRGVLLFSDCVQAACGCDLKKLCALCDAVSLSGHKIYGPKGAGALFVRRGVKIGALIAGGEQERGKRGGTTNTAGVVGFSWAVERAQENRREFCAHTGKLRDLFERTVFSALNEGARADGENRAPNISHITFENGGKELVDLLDLNGVACSAGAACSAHSAKVSHVMTAMGRSEEEAGRGVRFSFGRDTAEEETLFAARQVIDCVKRLAK